MKRYRWDRVAEEVVLEIVRPLKTWTKEEWIVFLSRTKAEAENLQARLDDLSAPPPGWPAEARQIWQGHIKTDKEHKRLAHKLSQKQKLLESIIDVCPSATEAISEKIDVTEQEKL